MEMGDRMRFLKRMNTVFYRLVISYIVLIIFTTIFMGIASYVSFSKNFNEEIEKVNSRMLSYVKKITDENIFRQAERIYVDITIPQSGDQKALSLFTRPVIGHHALIHEIYQQLKEMVSLNSELIHSIQIYYKENQLMISSMHGVNYLEDESEIEAVPWLRKVQQEYKGVLDWYHFDGTVALIGSYPYSDKAENLGYIAIILRDTALADVLTDSAGESSGTLFVAEPQGIVSTGNSESELNLAAHHIEEIMSGAEEDDYYLTDVDGTLSMISYTTLKRTGWKLINVTPVDEFYEKSETVRHTILIICIAALLIGGVISNIFTANIYNPLRSIIETARKLTGAQGKPEPVNEYKMINRVIDNLSIKVSDLEKTLSGNLPLIRSKLTEQWLRGKFETLDMIDERMTLAGLGSVAPYRYFNVLSLKFDESFIRSINTENSEFIKYNLLDQIEKSLPIQGMCLATEVDNEIHVVVCAKQRNQQSLRNAASYIMSYAYNNFMASMTAALGSWTEDPTKLGEIYQETKIILKYRYFYPKQKILSGPIYLEREKSDAKLDDAYFQQFNKALRQRNREKTEEVIKRFVEELTNGLYHADYGHENIKEFIYVYYSYVKSLNISTREILKGDMLTGFYDFAHIDQLKQWLLEVIRLTFEYLDDKQKYRNSELIDKVKAYITEHLHDDLSLNAVAEVVYLSPRYLSRIFKQETGENFVDYVTRLRMEKAGQMLLTSDLNIEQVAASVSYQNPAYFTKKFKEVYGMTPSAYRLQGIGSGEAAENNLGG